jgi:predicted ATPase
MIAKAQVTGDDLAAKRFERMHYIAADRNGPQELYFKSTLPNFLTVGKKGEYVGNVLLQQKTYAEIEDNLILAPKEDAYLGAQVGVWLSKILDTENVIVDINHLGGRVIVLNFLFKNDLNNKLKPENVGFGYSYILPIVLSGLIAKPGEILIVENPEAHLHPKAQNRLTQFLARVAACGVQVFVESHSEHILNGLRIATLQDDINIQHDEVNVLYFQDDAKQPFVKLPILKNGKIADWPDGFFDQQEQDLATIFKLGRSKK